VLFGAILTLGGVAGSMAAIYDVSTGRATVGDVFKTHAYALFLLLIPGLLLLFFNLVPFFKRGTEFQVHPDGSVSVRTPDSWEALMEYQYSAVTADGKAIDFTRGFDVESAPSSNSFTARRK
jgi:hypothetical protein